MGARRGCSADELFAIVADVKGNPLFVPWCSVRIHRADDLAIIADLVIGSASSRIASRMG
jgi:ribosome-associated toxin RatA of RatAB toxin-antitoxin module